MYKSSIYLTCTVDMVTQLTAQIDYKKKIGHVGANLSN